MNDRKPIQLEARPYGPDSTEAEQLAIKSLVTVPRENVIMYCEPPVVTAFSLDLFWERIGELAADMDYYFVLGDLSGTEPPNAEIRFHLRALYQTIEPVHVAVFTGKHPLLNVAAKFVLRRVLGKQRFSIHKTIDEALQQFEALRPEAARTSSESTA